MQIAPETAAAVGYRVVRVPAALVQRSARDAVDVLRFAREHQRFKPPPT